MGDEQHGLALTLPDAEQQFLHQRAGLVVERTERLVEQEDRRIVGERARNGRALLHAAGELFWVMVGERREADAREPFANDARALGFRYALLAQSERDVVGDREPGK